MTEPTQAQIDAALRAYSEAGAGHKGGMVAALTAAAQVGNPCDSIFDHKWLDPKCVADGCQSRALVAATIERCAQVAENHHASGFTAMNRQPFDIAAAIRALATEVTKEAHSPSSPSRAPR